MKKHSFSKILFFTFFLFLIKSNSFSQTTQNFTSTGTWTCPAGVTSATIQCWGAGGGGVTTPNTASYGGGGGGGGAYASSVITVVPGTNYSVSVGTGSAATNGGNSSFNSTTVVAVGGTAGANLTGGLGGASASCTGTTKNSGGNGGNGVTGTNSGGGGGGAGSTGNGGNATAATAGTGTTLNGGNGGAGGTVAPGNPGLNYGGGGAGAYGKSKTGGSGADGYVTITYTCPTYTLSTTSGATPISSGSSTTVTLTSSAAGLPVGTYTVTYNLTGSNTGTGLTATMTVSAAGSGTFTTGTLSTSGTTTVTITNITSGNCSSSISSNNTSVITTTGPITGCTSNTALYPSSTFTPACVGSPESITTAGYATEYSMVNVVSGTAYIFSTSISTDFITIANGAGGTPIYASGTTPVSWTSTITGTVRFYNNTNSSCGTNTSIRSRRVQCGTPPASPANDDCSAATTLISETTCSSSAGTIVGATASSQANGCSGTADDDVWFKFVATSTSHNISITNVTGSTSDLYHSVYAGSCAAPGTALVCSDPNSSTISGLTIGNTYYIRVYSYTSTSGQTSSFDICVTGCTSAPANDDCTGAIALTMNTYGSCASTSSGNVSCATPSGTASGSCFGTPDDDIWFSFVATSTSHSVTLSTTSGFDAYMQLYSGSCGSLTSLLCSDANTFSASSLVIGNTYYIRVYSYGTGTPVDGSLTMCVSAPAGCPANLGSGNVAIASLPYNGTGQTTCGAGNDITTSNVSTCGSVYYFYDEDKVYTFTPASSGTITITLNSTQSWTGATLYDGCPFSSNCVGYIQNSSSGSKNFCVSVIAGVTYYLVVDSDGTTGSCITSYTLNITAPSAGTPNELPCGATALTIGSSVTGNNTCTGSSGEPAIPSCWTTGAANTVWYSFVAPATGSVNIQTTAGTITSTQIALYSGACGSLSFISCNQFPSTGCAATASTGSLINATGLTSGVTYFIRVDGRNDNVGTFSIIVNNGVSSSSSPVPGQDCQIPLVVCSSVMTIGNPGYANTGNICDFSGADDCTDGEKNSVWYQISIAATGNFNFTLKPNDGTNTSCGAETDYDFLLWRISGTGATTNCAGITAASSGALLACNFDSYGLTGIASGGNAPSPVSTCFDGAFEPTVPVTAGDVLYLCIQNYAGSTQGFTLDMTTSGAGVVNYTTPSTVYWTGGASTVWTNATNWGSCATYPVCGVNAVVTAASATQPIITGTEYVKDLTINPGATLTLNAGAILHICGNFINNGSFVASPTSTVIFDNAAVAQSISGSFTGANKFGHLTITKTGSAVTANNDIDIAGNFLTSNSTSVFNSNNFYIKLAGNFSNATGNTTYTNTGTLGTLEFNGTAAQTYNQGSSTLDLNKVVMNHTGTGVTLSTNMNIKTSTGTLTLTLGKIITGSNEVTVANTAPTCVSTGNTTSYVEGNLRRFILSTGSYDFPVGYSTKGYQRANINFTSATSISNLLAKFNPWGITPVIQGGSECATTYNLQAENNGWWTITADANPSTGVYTTTLYPLGATNTSTAGGWTVMKTPTVESGTWSLVGNCVSGSTATVVLRTGMSGFSLFAVAQATVPLPIELLSFHGKNEGTKNRLVWSTSSETNNDYFSLEHSADGSSFETFVTKDGAGNSSVNIDYFEYDRSPFNGVTYYRLKQTDFNGEFTYSSIISVENKLNEIAVTNVHPNPTTDNINFDFSSPVKGILKIRIYDFTGRLVVEKVQNVDDGKTSMNTQMDGLPKGVYSLKVEFSEGSFNSYTKIVKY
jgi:hypothetical protein